MENIEKAPNVPPFVQYCAMLIPTVFDDSLSYYEALCALSKWLQDNVITVINNNATVTDSYIQLTNEYIQLTDDLKEYVENYFENLDVQTEINNKLDAMVEDGTLSAIIAPIVGDQIDQLASSVNASIAEFSKELGEARLNEIRKNYNNYKLVTKPTGFTEDFFTNFNIYTNNQGNYIVNYNKDDFINQSSTNTWYFAPDGDNANSGEDFDHAKLTIDSPFVSAMSDGDTIILKGGFYPKGAPFSNVKMTKSVNIIAEDGKDVILTQYDSTLVWTQYGNNSWSTTRSGIRTLFDITKWKEKKFTELVKVESLATLDATPNTYFVDGSTVYVHMYDNVKPSIETLGICLGVGYATTQFEPTANNAKLYIKGLTYIVADIGGIKADATTYSGCSVLVEDTNIFNVWCNGYNYDAFSNKGCASICNNVTVLNTMKDGFNYHNSTSYPAYGLEVDCYVNNCGEHQTLEARLSNNASTAHNYCKVIRVNGTYTLCNGGVVVDIDNALGACYGCVIADSYGRSYDLYATDNATIYAYDCYFKGSIATTNMKTGGAGTIYQSNCQYDTTQGNVIDLNA